MRVALSHELKEKHALQKKKLRQSKAGYIPGEQLNSEGAKSRCDLASPYKLRSSAGKAVARGKAALPQNDALQKYVWQYAGIEYGYILEKDIQTEDKRSSMVAQLQHINRQDHLIERISKFYLRRGISYVVCSM